MDNVNDIPNDAYFDDSNFSMQIMFNYAHYNDNLYKKQRVKGESFISRSKKYHSNKNRDFVNKIDTGDLDIFVSEYTPYVFINCHEESTIDKVVAYAKSISNNKFINSIRIFPSDIYNLDLQALEVIKEDTVEGKNVVQATSSSTDSRVAVYDNFPAGTVHKGSGIKIGILDSGVFNTSHSNFRNITAETVYDTYTDNNSSSAAQHPTWVASVLGGKYGYASAASLYYVDVNSETSYVGIERLINKGCHIVNMSISAASCMNNGEYNTGLEGYLDYIYTSTKVIMVACTSNNLNIEGTGGYVSLPALCANVISVGSVTSSGKPSEFSCYKRKNDVNSNPNIVAVGSDRYIGGFNNKSGTSFSTPAVTGAIALYFGKNGVKDLPAVLSVLSATANDSAVYKSRITVPMRKLDSTGNYVSSGNTISCTNNLKANGSRERTGAGLLDVTALLNYSNSLLNYEVIFTSKDYIEIKDIYIASGRTVQIALAWQRNATLTKNYFLWWETGRTYSSDKLADLDLYLYNNSGTMVDSSTASMTNVEILTYTANKSGYYTIKIKPYSNYADTHNINYAYTIK
ncbi:MAG: hypothetical protein E7490_05700 [Ruminococcaceae bacterium]|nr:hypothetical protein [Oscillospiraceae bacterium]